MSGSDGGGETCPWPVAMSKNHSPGYPLEGNRLLCTAAKNWSRTKKEISNELLTISMGLDRGGLASGKA